MTAAVFEARWNRIIRSREQGYEELSDFLGRHASYGPLVRCGLLRRRQEDSEYQRYNGYLPTERGADHLLYIPDKELILVRPEKSASLYLALQSDPAPKAVFKATYAEPTGKQFDVVKEMRQSAGRDVWRVQRADELERRLLAGYMDIRQFTVRTGLGEGALLREGVCAARAEKPHERALPFEVTAKGAHLLEVADPWELLLVKPGMELPLFEALDPERASYWCTLP